MDEGDGVAGVLMLITTVMQIGPKWVDDSEGPIAVITIARYVQISFELLNWQIEYRHSLLHSIIPLKLPRSCLPICSKYLRKWNQNDVLANNVEMKQGK